MIPIFFQFLFFLHVPFALDERSPVNMHEMKNVFTPSDRQHGPWGITCDCSRDALLHRAKPLLQACIYITACLCHITISASNTLTNCPDSALTHCGSMRSVHSLTTSGSSDLIFWEMYLRLSRHTGKI